MVRQNIVDVDIKKLKMAKEVLAVLSIMGISERNLDDLVNLDDRFTKVFGIIEIQNEKIEDLEAKISKLEDVVSTFIKETNTRNAKEATNSYSEGIKKSFSKVEDYRLDGKAR